MAASATRNNKKVHSVTKRHQKEPNHLTKGESIKVECSTEI
jgi:hypothetical protein